MNNTERREALAIARRRALDYAREADIMARIDIANLDADALMALTLNIKMADMWAHVAQSMKVGNAIETDGADGLVTDGFTLR